MVTLPATQRITFYKVECPDCGHKGKLAFQGEAVVQLDMLFCPRCPDQGGGPMLVYQRNASGRWAVRP